MDWNCQCTAHHRLNTGHTLRGCVDWNFTMQFVSMGKHCHTLRGCVDWNSLSFTIFYYGSVTPCVGVWIETSLYHVSALTTSVTPCVGVWIETLPLGHGTQPTCHTLRGCVDWNYFEDQDWGDTTKSHPAWVCGLKPWGFTCAWPCCWSHPAWVCGLKRLKFRVASSYPKSHPAWVCGLKRDTADSAKPVRMSHPAWVCGLKPTFPLSVS